MAKTKTLLDLVKGLRAELRHEIAPNHGINTEERFRILLNNMEEELFQQYDWDDIKVYRYIAVRAGERYYDFPADLDELSTIKWEYKWNTIYLPLTKAIDIGMLAQRDNERDERSDPVLAYQLYLDDEFNKTMFEIWPIPSQDGIVYRPGNEPSPKAETPAPNPDPDGDRFLRLRGMKKPTEMIKDSDRCMLDSRLIILFAAAQEAAAQGSTDAPALLQRAQSRLRTLQKNLKKTDAFVMGTDLYLKNKKNSRSQTVNDIRFRFAPNT
jgi:hypothetical protein